jgi:hypothetical protein
MQELTTQEAALESQHSHADANGTPQPGLERWWETPAMAPPPPPNPAIYGLDENEVAIGLNDETSGEVP